MLQVESTEEAVAVAEALRELADRAGLEAHEVRRLNVGLAPVREQVQLYVQAADLLDQRSAVIAEERVALMEAEASGGAS